MLTVIIGTLNCERALVRTLSTLVPAAATGAVREVIVADAGSTDDTREVADMAGCNVTVSSGLLARALRTAAGDARASWLMFLQPGTILDSAWADETAQFVQQMDMLEGSEKQAAIFRRGVRIGGHTTMLADAMGMLRAALLRKIDPAQGLVIAKQHYDRVGGHNIAVSDPQEEFLRRIGRRHIVTLRSGASMLAAS